MSPYIRAAVVVLARSGLCIGELLGLKVSDVDFKAGSIRVERQRLQAGSVGPPKTAKSRRTMPFGEVVMTLRIYARRWPGEEDRTRSVMDAVLGGLRTGCGQVGDMTRETAGQNA